MGTQEVKSTCMEEVNTGNGITIGCARCGVQGTHVCFPALLDAMAKDKNFLKQLAELVKDFK